MTFCKHCGDAIVKFKKGHKGLWGGWMHCRNGMERCKDAVSDEMFPTATPKRDDVPAPAESPAP